MNFDLSIGTWNLDRSGIRKTNRISGQLHKILELNADIWVLTESHSAVDLPGYYSVSSNPDPGYHEKGESCATIWSRYPLTKLKVENPVYSICAEMQPENMSRKLLVYGTIITYRDDGVNEGVAPWERHRAAVRQQTAEWKRLREKYSDHLLCVAGDFNMNLDTGPYWYGLKEEKEYLIAALKNAGMYCATSLDVRQPPFGLSRASVDHICVSNELSGKFHMEAWEDKKMSDHNGVLIRL